MLLGIVIDQPSNVAALVIGQRLDIEGHIGLRTGDGDAAPAPCRSARRRHRASASRTSDAVALAMRLCTTPVSRTSES